MPPTSTTLEIVVQSALKALAAAVAVLLLGGLLIVFVGKVRDAASRVRCQNNLQALALGVSSYHDSCNQFPQAIVPNASLPPEKCLGLCFRVASYAAGSTNLYVRMDEQKGWEAEENRYLAVMGCPPLRCPGYPDAKPASTLVPTHYVGIAGIGADAATLPLDDPRAGFFGYERKLSRADIRRGASRLLVLVETTRTQGAWTAGGPPTVRGLEEGTPYLGAGGQFGGTHPKTTYPLFADGSIRPVSDSVAPRAFEAMATIRGSRDAEAVGD
jgi:hypothetical protein